MVKGEAETLNGGRMCLRTRNLRSGKVGQGTDSFGHARRIAREMRISPPRICQLKEKLRDALESIGYGNSATKSDVA